MTEGTERGSPWQRPQCPGAAAAFAPSHRQTLHPALCSTQPQARCHPLGKSLGVLGLVLSHRVCAGSVLRCFPFAGFLVQLFS